MQCTSPRKVGFKSDGKTLAWSQKELSKQYASFQLPCGKCIECRLEYARQWAVRCVHEAQMHENNIFLTLTYNDENLKSPKLIYSDFQDFIRKVRKLQNEPISYFVTGEYGEKNKRPHWHAIIFNFSPRDLKYERTTERGDKAYGSVLLTDLWSKGRIEIGNVTFESAGYCARYAAKKLVHGQDDQHDYKPISKKSSKRAIGRTWLESYWPDVFTHGRVVLRNGTTTAIPRYYEKWLKEHRPADWLKYLNVKLENSQMAQKKAQKEENDYFINVFERNLLHKPNPLTPLQRKKIFAELKLKTIQENLKL